MKNIYDDVNKPENEAETQNVFSAQGANAQPQYAPPMQDGQVPYAQPQYAPPMQEGQVPYAQPQYAPPMQEGQVPYAQPQYAPPMQEGQVPYAQPQYAPPMQDGQVPYAQPPMYAQNPYGQPMYPMYPQPPYGQPMYAQPMYNPYAQPVYAPPVQQPVAQNAGAMYGLSKEQMDELVSQYLVSKKDEQQDGETEKASERTIQDNVNSLNPNARVIFQSDDFDKIEDVSTEDRDNGEFRVDDEPLGFGEQINEEIQQEPQVKELESFDPEFVEGDISNLGLPTNANSDGFSVFEVEVAQEEFNAISRKHPVTVKAVDLPQPKQEETVAAPIYTKPKLPDGFVVEEFEEVLDPIAEFKAKDFTKKSSENTDTTENNFEVEQEEVFFNFDEMQEDEQEEKEIKQKKAKKESKPKVKKSPKKKKKISKFEIVRKMVLSLAVVGIIGSCGMLGYEYWLSRENKALENEVNDLLIDVDSLASEDESDKKGDKDKDKDKDKTDKVMTVEQQWEEIKKEFPDVVFPVDTKLEYAKLYATNQDFAGYLSAKGVNLSLPVVQTENDDDYYRTNFYGVNTKYGCPFVTHVNNINPLDQNTVIFGHHMNDGTVFGALDAYKSIDGFKAAPVVTFDTLTTDYEWKVVAAFITNAYAEEDDGYIFKYYFTQLSTEERFSAYLSELSKRSLYDTGVDVLPTDKLLTLSTCSHEFDEARFVVVARLVRPGESVDVDTSLASVNPNPRYPQAYYDVKGITNPFKNTYNWEVG